MRRRAPYAGRAEGRAAGAARGAGASRSPRPDRGGAALVVVVLALLAMTGLAHGMLVAARTERAASAAGGRLLASRAAAEGVLVAALAAAPGPWMDSVPLWGARGVVSERYGPLEAVGRFRRAGPESWLVEGVARRDGRTVAGSAALTWAMAPTVRAAAVGAVLRVDTGSVALVEGVVDGAGYTDPAPPPEVAACARWAAALDSVASPFLPAVATTPLAVDGPRVGLLAFDAIFARADPPLTGAGTPAPVVTLGRCEPSAPWNWGDPERPWTPCGSHLPLTAGLGPLQVEGGVGQGLLVVDGDVTLDAGARYVGLVLTTGLLRLEDGAELVGAAVAAGGAYVSPDSRVRGSACAVARALDAHRATLGRPVPLEGPDLGPW